MVVKIPPSMMMGSWMGSDFTNDDLVKSSNVDRDYNAKIVEIRNKDGVKQGKCVLIPKPNAPVVWGKLYMWISKDKFLELKVEYYDETDELINTMYGRNIKDVNDRTIPTKMVMIPADNPGNKTIFEYDNIKFNNPMNDWIRTTTCKYKDISALNFLDFYSIKYHNVSCVKSIMIWVIHKFFFSDLIL